MNFGNHDYSNIKMYITTKWIVRVTSYDQNDKIHIDEIGAYSFDDLMCGIYDFRKTHENYTISNMYIYTENVE